MIRSTASMKNTHTRSISLEIYSITCSSQALAGSFRWSSKDWTRLLPLLARSVRATLHTSGCHESIPSPGPRTTPASTVSWIETSQRRRTYSTLNVTADQNLPALGATHHGRDLRKLASLACRFNLDRLGRHLIGVHPARVLPPPEDQSSLMFVTVDNSLLDVQMDRGLHRAHEASAHVDPSSTEAQGRHQSIAICESSGGNEGRVAQLLTGSTVENQGCDVRFAHMTSTFKTVDGQNVDTEFDSRLRMPYRGGPTIRSALPIPVRLLRRSRLTCG